MASKETTWMGERSGTAYIKPTPEIRIIYKEAGRRTVLDDTAGGAVIGIVTVVAYGAIVGLREPRLALLSIVGGVIHLGPRAAGAGALIGLAYHLTKPKDDSENKRVIFYEQILPR